VTGPPPDEPPPPLELELEDAQAASTIAAAQAAAGLLIVESFTLVLLSPESVHAADVEIHDGVVVKQFLCGTVEPVAPEHEDVAPVRVA
jgi:hypothetical protein